MPIIVGVPRSGTTLLRLMLDAHSDLAIPPETHFIPAVAKLDARASALREVFFRAVTAMPTWSDFHLSKEQFFQSLLQIEPFALSEGIRAFYRLYPRRLNKWRWGDKTPPYSLHLTTLESLLPEAYFIHIIRDGRDVALSVKGLWFAPGEDLETIAADWCHRVKVAHIHGQRFRHYLEIHYEDLVTDTTKLLKHICDYIELPYEPRMEKYYLFARQRLEEHESWYNPDGTVLITKDERFQMQRLTTYPPDRSRISRWKNEMSKEDRSRFERVAGRMLQGLGYET